MKKGIKLTALAMCTLLLSAPLASCGGGKDSSSSTSSSSSSSSSTSVAPTNWTASEEALMKKYLDGYVLPYTSLTGTMKYDSEYECVTWISSKAGSQANIDKWAALCASDGFSDEDDADEDHLLRKTLQSGKVVVVSTYVNQDSKFEFDAYLFDAPETDWTEEQKETIESATEPGFTLPFISIPGDIDVQLYEGTLYVFSYQFGSYQDVDRYASLLKNDGYTMSEDEYGDPIGTKTLASGAQVSINTYLGSDYSFYITVDYMRVVTSWPAEQIATYLGSEITTVVPEFTWDKYMLPAPTEESFTIRVIDEVTSEKTEAQCKAETENAYKTTLESASWLVQDYYYESYGVYQALDTTESVVIEFGWNDGIFQIDIGKYTSPYQKSN